jgi:acyl-CoA hydrolase
VDPRRPSESTSFITRWMSIADANASGNVHGGTIMRMCDEVAGIAAIRHSGSRVVTAGMDRMVFRHPVLVGMLVTVKATVNGAWRTSMEVGVRVEAEDVPTGEVTHTSTAYLTMVALGPDGRPVEVPHVKPETEDELRRYREAELRRAGRLREREEIAAARTAPGE